MQIAIIEDEKAAAEMLIGCLLSLRKDISIVACCNTIESSIALLQTSRDIDLIFMDIELGDGASFRIFEQVTVPCPVIFTTAYDEYWQKAFEYNCIDYLLKPIKEAKLALALQKYEWMKKHFAGNLRQLMHWTRNENQQHKYRKRFLVKRGSDLISVQTADLSYCYAAYKMVCLMDKSGRKYILDQSLVDIEHQLDPDRFFRVNRKYLVQLNAIKKITSLGKGKLLLDLDPSTQEEVIVSPEHVADFKAWMDR